MPSSNKKTVKFLFTAQIHRLSIKKNIKFLTKIAWKRRTLQIKIKTTTRPKHNYNNTIMKVQLQINLVWDQEKQLYEEKNTQIVAVIEYEGKVKSGGYIKYNVAPIVNNNLRNKLQTISLTQCPDPNAFVQITFDYAISGQNLDTSMSLLNVSSRDLNMSRIDFNDDKLSLQINRINNTVNKLNDLTSKVKNKENQLSQNQPKLKMTIQMLEGQKSTLKKQVQTLQKSHKKIQQEHQQQKLKLLKQVAQLEKQLQKKQKEIKSQTHIDSQDKKNYKQTTANSDKYKKLYQQALEQIEQLKSMNMKNSIQFKANFDDVQEIAHFQNSDDQDNRKKKKKTQKFVRINYGNSAGGESQISIQEAQMTLEDYRKKTDQLQQNLATMSYKLASLFNASYEFGGAQLLDYLQTAIGLTQKN